jgi:hypothetical protein
MTDDTRPGCPFGFDGRPGSRPLVAPAMAREERPALSPAPIVPGEGGRPTGRCLCGGVSFRIDTEVSKVFADHVEAARRWTGGIALTLVVRATNTTFHGWGGIVHYAHTEAERRCFCRRCGSSLFARRVEPAALSGMLSLSAGALDEPLPETLTLAAETAIDRKPGYYALAGERRRMTEEEVEALFAPRPAAE